MATTIENFHVYLKSLVGKMIKVNRGGPESKSGQLLAVKSDFLVLYVTDTESVVYYQLKHIRSITENSKIQSRPHTMFSDFIENLRKVNSFYRLMKFFQNETIQLNQGGPEVLSGKLLDVTNHYAVLYSGGKVVYVNLEHIKSFSPKEERQTSDEKKEDSVRYVKVNSFDEILNYFLHQWVSINGGGPEALEGVLSYNGNGTFILINKEEVIRIQPFHVRSIFGGARKQQDQKSSSKTDKKTGERKGEEDEVSDDDDHRTDKYKGRCSEHKTSSKFTGTSKTRKRERDVSPKSTRSSKYQTDHDVRWKSRNEEVVKSVHYRWKG